MGNIDSTRRRETGIKIVSPQITAPFGPAGRGAMNSTRAGNRRPTLRSLLVALVATAAACCLTLPTAVPPDPRLSANTLLVMGGNRNPNGVTPSMQQQLGGDPWYPAHNTNPLTPVGVRGAGYIDAENNPNSPYAGWDFTLVNWPAEISLPMFGWKTFGESQRLGQTAADTAVAAVMPTLDDGEQALAFGYSSSANVMVRVMRELQQQGAPYSDRLAFTLLGNPNRPNGGILQRFAGLYIPILDVDFDGSTPLDTPYQTVDISWKYEPASDFPTYPLNLLAVLNSLIGGSMLHGNYYRADIDGQRAFPDTTVGNITYITLEPPHLPLLLPLYELGFPAPLLELVEPALTVMVDWGYDRTVGPGIPTGARLLPPVDPMTAAADLADAIGQGVRNAAAALSPGDPAGSAPAVTVGSRFRSAEAVRVATSTPETPSPRTGRLVHDSRALTAAATTRAGIPGGGNAGSVDRKADRHERNEPADRNRR
ncbi:MAG: hypothetical protein QG655_1255 [Actinomycetota bacterium]|nr:hypothetical protein [Actinomycetota bacterium]